MNYLLFKSIHLVSMVAWFAGLFYLVRLFVYHSEALQMEDSKRAILTEQYHIMETRLYRIICNPAMILTWVFGLLMLYNNGLSWLSENPWMHVKLTMVFLLTGYHHFSPRMIRSLKEGKSPMSAFRFRLYNEVPTIFLLGIIVLAVYKNLSNFAYVFGGLILFAIVLFIFARLYKKQRNKSINPS